MTLALPIIIANNFQGKESSAGMTPFTLELTPPGANAVQITFTGTRSVSVPDVLATQNDGVGIELRDMFLRRVSPGNPVYYPVEPSGSRLQFTAGYIQTTEGEVASSDISATVHVEMKYLKFIE